MFQEQIPKGVEYLDQDLGPSWVERIDLVRLDLNDCHFCVIGQLLGGFWSRIEYGSEWHNRGFLLPLELVDNYNILTQEWHEKISQLRAERAN